MDWTHPSFSCVLAVVVDVVVIGMGPGGEEVAGKLATAGLDVVGVEAELVGGECPYWGCIPSKMMVRAGNLLAESGRVAGMAGTVDVVPDWSPVAARIRNEATDNWNDQVAVDRFTGHGGRFVRGRAQLTGPAHVTVDEQVFHARRGIVIATGTHPVSPPIDGLDRVPFWTNRDAISCTEVPESLIVIGGGAVGVELAQAFARFGTRVTILEGGPRLLPAEEPQASDVVEAVLRAERIIVSTAARVSSVIHDGSLFSVSTDDGVVSGARLLVATGRSADLSSLGLEAIGVDASARWLPVDGHMQVTDGVWAVGDVTGKGAFTHVAMYQAAIAIRSILGQPGPAADYRALPRVTFTDPEVGSVGLTEQGARDAGLRVQVGIAVVPSTARGWIHKAGNDGVIKVVADADAGILVGASSVGPVGGEVLGLLTLAVHARVPVDHLRHMMYAYPTFHRGVEDAIRDLR